jgi:Mn-dependent DtxR family transcriptional regulator
MGLRLLRLFDLVTPKGDEVSKPQLSNEEIQALTYVNACVAQHKHPTVRGVAEAIGKQSSRSGMRMVDALQKRGLVNRDEEGRINLTDQGSSFAA